MSDAPILAAATSDGRVVLLSARQIVADKKLKGAIGGVVAQADSLVVATNAGVLHRLSLPKLDAVLEVKEHDASYVALAACTLDNEPAIAAASAHGVIYVVHAGKLEVIVEHDEAPKMASALTGLGAELLYGTDTGELRRLATRGSDRVSYFAPDAPVTHVVSDGGKALVLVEGGLLLSYGIAEDNDAPNEHSRGYTALGPLDDRSALLVTIGGEARRMYFDALGSEPLGQVAPKQVTHCAGFRDFVAVGNADGEIALYRVGSGGKARLERLVTQKLGAEVTALAFLC